MFDPHRPRCLLWELCLGELGVSVSSAARAVRRDAFIAWAIPRLSAAPVKVMRGITSSSFVWRSDAPPWAWGTLGTMWAALVSAACSPFFFILLHYQAPGSTLSIAARGGIRVVLHACQTPPARADVVWQGMTVCHVARPRWHEAGSV